MRKVLVNIGCGFTAGESWLNFDASPTLLYEKAPFLTTIYKKNEVPFPKNVKYGDITKRRLCTPDTADAVFASHVFEHLAHDEMQNALQNIFAMLKPGGIFRLIVPDLENRARKYIENVDKKRSKASLEFISATGMGIKNSPKTLIRKLTRLFGHSQHLWMYDMISMESELEQVGFVNVRKCFLMTATSKNSRRSKRKKDSKAHSATKSVSNAKNRMSRYRHSVRLRFILR